MQYSRLIISENIISQTIIYRIISYFCLLVARETKVEERKRKLFSSVFVCVCVCIVTE